MTHLIMSFHLNQKYSLILRSSLVAGLVLVDIFMFIYSEKKFPTITKQERIETPIKNELTLPDVETFAQLVKYLRKQGYNVVIGDIVSGNSLTVAGESIKINDQEVRIYTYSGSDAAKKDATAVLKNIAKININNKGAQVHYYRQGKMIAYYDGSNEDTLRLLEKVFGPQFAGE